MASLNKVQLIGFLGKDPDCRYMPNGDQVVNITVATTDTWKDKNSGEKKEATEWHRVVFFRKLAEIAGQYLKKGSPVYIEGALKTRKWEKDGTTHYTTEIVADSMQMLGRKPEGAGGPPPQGQASRPAAAPTQSGGGSDGNFNDFEDDIPFISCSVKDDVILRRLNRCRRI